MSFAIPESQLEQLRTLVDVLKLPEVGSKLLNAPEMKFFKEYLESLGASIPAPEVDRKEAPVPPTPTQDMYEEENEPVPDLAEPEIDSEEDEGYGEEDDEDKEFEEGTIPREVVDEEHEKFGDMNREVTDEMLMESETLKSEARSAASEGNYDIALTKITEAILLNPTSASLIARRAEILLKMVKPAAAIYNCDHAIQLNKNNASAYYVRGKAHAIVGEWEEALHDVLLAEQLDGDLDADELVKVYREKAEAVKARKEKKRKREEKRAAKKAKQSSTRQEQHPFDLQEEDEEEDFVPPQGGSGFNPNMFGSLFKDPEILGMLSNPKVQKMMSEVMTNPAKMSEYMQDPELAPMFSKFMGQFGGPGAASAGEEFSPDTNPTHSTMDDIDVD